MATAKKTAAKAKPTGTSMVAWDQELAKYAEQASAQEDTAQSGGGMKWFSTKSGVLSFDDNQMPGNKMGVIILDSMFEHVYYEGKFDPNVKSPPKCFALGRDEGELVPHEDVFKRNQEENDTCAGCPMNEFGSADTGRGKACRNTRRLAVIPAGTYGKNGDFKLIDDPEHYAETPLAFIKIPVTSTTAFKAFTKQITGQLRKPLFAIAAEISLVPDPKNQFAMKFAAIEELDFGLLDTIFGRVKEAEGIIGTGYNLDEDEEDARPARGGRGKPAARGAKSSARPAAKGKAPAKSGRKY